MHMTRGNVIIQNVCLKISLGLFKTLLKDLSLNKEKKELRIFFVPKKRETPYIFLNKTDPYECTQDKFDIGTNRAFVVMITCDLL